MSVLLVSMPYGALERQALGLSLLKARLAERGVRCEIRYLAFVFADLIGLEDYRWISTELPYTAFAGDWSFTRCLYGPRPDAESRYVDEILRRTWRLPDAAIDRVLRIRSMTQHFLDYVLAAVPWAQYQILGFTSTFEQNIASLALARRLKDEFPRIQTVFGGANWEADMGVELHRKFPFVDYVCGGEAEMSFPALVERLCQGSQLSVQGPRIPGIVYRDRGASVSTGPGEAIPSLDALPIPDYGDYFRDLGESSIGASVVPTLLFETSRGCWWGAKSHCTFCGLNGGAMAFRSKSQRRALDELRYLVERWRVEMVEAVDNILDMKYFTELLPELARAGLGAQIFYEVKANLTRRHLRLLKDAGVHRIQPGIESLNDHVLSLMRKGTTGLRNIQLLKWCKEYEITVEWNLLYGFPGETLEDYAETLRLLPLIRHLNPPTACGPLRLDRFSPYHEAQTSFGLVNVRPLSTYQHLYPFEESSLRRIAYYFDFDYAPGIDPRGFADEVVRYAEQWKRAPELGTLTAMRRPDGGLALADTRAGATATALTLHDREQAAYEYCDEAHSVAAVTRYLRESFPDRPTQEKHVRSFLDAAVSRKLMARANDHYVNLAIATEPLRRELEQRRSQTTAPARQPIMLTALPAESWR